MPEQHVDGVSILPLITTEEQEDLNDRPLFWHYPHYSNQGCTPGCAVRKGHYKLLEFFEDNHVELYNVYEDVSEEHDLAQKMPDKVKELKDLLDKWKLEVKAKIPQPNPNYKR